MTENTNSPIRNLVLDRPESVSSSPSLSLFLLAKNAESCLPRLLNNVGPYIKEVTCILNDTTDASENILREFCASSSKNLILENVTSESHPRFYLQDTAATYEVGRSLSGEVFQGPFLEKPILGDWAGIRNALWNACTSSWKLFLDADDVLLDPECLPSLLVNLEKLAIELVDSEYRFLVRDMGGTAKPAHGQSYRERIAYNTDKIRWVRRIHENLTGTIRRSRIEGSLIAQDMRDNKGFGIRYPGRNFKILYHECRQKNWQVDPRTLVNLLVESRAYVLEGAFEVSFPEAILKAYLARAEWPEERGWANALMGEIYEGRERFREAMQKYLDAIEEHRNPKTFYRLSRVHYELGNWSECVDVFEEGQKQKHIPQSLDDGPMFEHMGKILAAKSCEELGRLTDARKYCAEAREHFPTNSVLAAYERQLLEYKYHPVDNDKGEG